MFVTLYNEIIFISLLKRIHMRNNFYRNPYNLYTNKILKNIKKKLKYLKLFEMIYFITITQIHI